MPRKLADCTNITVVSRAVTMAEAKEMRDASSQRVRDIEAFADFLGYQSIRTVVQAEARLTQLDYSICLEKNTHKK